MPGNLTPPEVTAAIAAGEIDTVIVGFADAQGRLVGKRVSARLFQEEVLHHGAEACNYLLSVDVDMNTVDGYTMASWETGYGDMMLLPDVETLRRIPWQPGTALVMADLGWEGGDPVAQSPRAILQAQRTVKLPGHQRRAGARSPCINDPGHRPGNHHRNLPYGRHRHAAPAIHQQQRQCQQQSSAQANGGRPQRAGQKAPAPGLANDGLRRGHRRRNSRRTAV